MVDGIRSGDIDSGGGLDSSLMVLGVVVLIVVVV